MIKILIADDHLLVRAGFKRLLEKEIDLKVVGECRNAAEVLSFIRENECDVIVLDIDMAGKSGLDLLADLRSLAPEIKILMQSIHPEERYAVRALKAGACGYITKEAAADELITAIRAIAYGGKYVSQALAQKLASDLEKPAGKPHERLSDREFEVLRLLGAGKSANEIAAMLSLSLNTVNTYRKRILEKMGMNSTSELIHYAVRNDLVI